MLLFLAIQTPQLMINGRLRRFPFGCECHHFCHASCILSPSHSSFLFRIFPSSPHILRVSWHLRKRWFMDFAFDFHKVHLPGPCMNLDCRMSQVGIFLFKMHQKKIFDFGGLLSFHSCFDHHSGSPRPFLFMRKL